MLKNNTDIFALCETNLHDNIQDSDFQLPGYLPIHHNDAGHIHGLGVYVKSNLLIAQETILEDENECVFCLAFLHSTTFIFFLYHSPSSSSCSVVEAVSSNIDKTLILQPSNIMECGDFNAHNYEWLCHSHTTDVAGLLCQEFAMAKDLIQISLFASLTVMIISHIFLTYSFVQILTLALLLPILLWENLTIW